MAYHVDVEPTFAVGYLKSYLLRLAQSRDYQRATVLSEPGFSRNRQAFKEEAIKIWALGGARNAGRTTTYNEIASPGVNYIISDTY